MADGHQAIISKGNKKSKTNKKQTNNDNKNKPCYIEKKKKKKKNVVNFAWKKQHIVNFACILSGNRVTSAYHSEQFFFKSGYLQESRKL